MIPLQDDVECQKTPVVNYTIIALCSLMFLLQLWSGEGNMHIVERLGMVPARLTSPDGEPVLVAATAVVSTPFGPRVVEGVRALEPSLVPEWFTLVTCVFLHGGWLHFIGNMWFLYIFGDNVEDRLGHVTYAALYLGTGVVAGLSHLIVNFESTAPTIGASGAIAGVMGCYLWMFPRSRVLTVVPLVVFWPIIVLPGPIFLTIWFVMQFWSGSVATVSPEAAGVAWWAHIGGFLSGFACAAALGRPHEPPTSSAAYSGLEFSDR